jgi:ATPase subunit of ABC transporter with duplicated ATPase domains
VSSLLTLDSVSAAAPDGRLLFEGLSLSVARNQRVGLVGRNGSGKSTLLAIVQGKAQPIAGHVAAPARIGALAQDLPPEQTVANAIGISRIREAVARIEVGEGTDGDFAFADWTLDARVAAALGSTDLTDIDLDRRIESFSGGERTRIGIARLLLEAPDLILLDEPTNNLDAAGRAAVDELLARWDGAAIVASHDRQLLERMDRIVELNPIAVRQFGGGWSGFAAAREAERQRAEATLAAAKQDLKSAKRSAQTRDESKARRDRAGKTYAASGSAPKILMGRQAERAENSTGRDGKLAERQLNEAAQKLTEANALVEVTIPLAFNLPSSHLPSSKELLSIEEATVALAPNRVLGPWTLKIRGPERVAIRGPNGAGKSTLLRLAMGDIRPASGTVKRADGRLAMMDQHVALLDPSLTVIENYKRRHREATRETSHAALARFAFRNRDAQRLVGTLSGGERLRAALAVVLGGTAPPQLLALDEPTNHVDLESIEALELALSLYDGAILVVSHDQSFIDRIGVSRDVSLGL